MDNAYYNLRKAYGSYLALAGLKWRHAHIFMPAGQLRFSVDYPSWALAIDGYEIVERNLAGLVQRNVEIFSEFEWRFFKYHRMLVICIDLLPAELEEFSPNPVV